MRMQFKYCFFTFIFSLQLVYVQGDKSADSFASLIETHDNWSRASTAGDHARPPLPLNDLIKRNAKLNQLERYTRIHLDYGYQRKERDPMHLCTVLELRFKKKEDIPSINNEDIQRYPRCVGSLMFNEISEPEKKQVFPLWDYKELEHGQVINWKHREYIKWYAIRYYDRIFIVYNETIMWMDAIDEYAELLYQYLSADTEEKMQVLIAQLQASKDDTSIAFDTVALLQKTLSELGFDPGPVDGRYGDQTEKALAELLIQLDFLDSYQVNNSFKRIRKAIKEFQAASELPVTGRCEKETIDALVTAAKGKEINDN